nr:putative retrotransposon protein [Tanacetum cinerariifolium]
QCATTSAEMKRMQNVPYALVVGSIMYVVRGDTKSQTGYVFILNGGAVVWKSSKQSTTAQHVTETEYIAASEAAKEAVWIRKFIDELGVVPSNNYLIKMNCEILLQLSWPKNQEFKKALNNLKENTIMFVSALKLVKLILSKFIHVTI